MHIWEDAYIVEIIDPETSEPLDDGQQGEVVLTNLIRRATPILRYRTRDLAFLHPEPCQCGRTHRRLSRIMGRTDDMLAQLDVLKGKIKEELRASIVINPVIKLHEPGFLPVSEGKAKRVIDMRPEL
jgi:phenylacetate-CoA ligase